MMVNYYQIKCNLETKLEFNEFHETFNHIPNINDIVSFLNHQSLYKIVENAEAQNTENMLVHHNNNNHLLTNHLLSIIIELPLIILPIIDHNDAEFTFYGFSNGKLLLFRQNEEMELNHIESSNKTKICYKDILSILNLKPERFSFGNPKCSNLELNIFEQINIAKLMDVDEPKLEILKVPE